MLFWCTLSFVIIIIMLFITGDSRGCVKVILCYIICLVCVFLFVNLRSCANNTISTDVMTVKTKNDIMYGHFNYRYLCPSKNIYYCVMNSDSSIKPNQRDTCVYCGQIFRKHHYKKTYEEEHLENVVRDAFLETPAE